MLRISPERSSPWMIEFHKQLLRGKQVLLYGNVADQFLLNDRYLSLAEFLNTYLREEGYAIIGNYDIVDGLQMTDPSMQPEFERILSTKMGGDASLTAPTGGDAPQPAVPPRRVPRAAGGQFSTALRTPDQALEATRIMLGQSNVSTAMVIHFSDQLVGDPQRHTENERPHLVQLKKTIKNAAYLLSGPLAGRKNALVIVAEHLGAVPPWLYHDNPFLALVHVERPQSHERMSFIRGFIRHFHEGDTLAPEQVEEVARLFADLTEGLTAWDMEAIRRTSISENLSVTQPKVLVDYYKYGRRDDPWERLDPSKIRGARKQLEERVIGQPAAVEAVVNMLLSARVGISIFETTAKTGKPKGTFFFVGPTGVGKTELAKALTELIFGDDAAFARFDMSEYAEQHAAEKLTGSPPGYVGYDEGGQLTNRMRERPFSLLLFDEIEKAHGRVMDKFLQILEDGRLTDGRGQTVYFSQSVIVFTSNIGSDTLDLRVAGAGGDLLPYEVVRQHYLAAVRNHFTRPAPDGLGRPELLNRLGDNVLVFDLLRPEHIGGICQKFLNALIASARNKRGLELVFPDSQVVEMIRNLMLTGDNLLFGGRRIKSLLEGTVEHPLNRWVFFNEPPPGTTLVLTPAPDGHGILINGSTGD